jgi:hypothetical protein
MKKIFVALSVLLIPAISFAQGYMMDSFGRSYGYSNTIWDIILLSLIPLVWFCFFALMFVFWLVMLIDAIKNSPEKMKTIWVIVIIFTQIIGALIYYFVEKRPKYKIKHTEKKDEIK